MSPHFLLWPYIGIMLSLSPLAGLSSAEEPLHQAIDRFVTAQAGGPIAPLAGDAEFLRRVYLDLAGKIPTVAETRAFFADPASDKRTKLIDRLLAAPDFPRRMRELFHA